MGSELPIMDEGGDRIHIAWVSDVAPAEGSLWEYP